MAPPASLGQAWRSFWHTMTSNDRHATHDSPYRTGQHVPLPQSRHAPLTSVATSAVDSRHDLSSAYSHDEIASPTKSFHVASPEVPGSPRSPYAPGMRSASNVRADSRGRPGSAADSQSKDGANVGIQMQDFAGGAAPPPPVSHSWKRIDRWTRDKYEELAANICDGCTQNDVNELEHELDVTLPLDVRESLQTHDGQERGGLPTGLIFGCMLLDCEEIVEEWRNWRKVNEDILSDTKKATTVFRSTPQAPGRALGGAGPSTTSPPPRSNTSSPTTNWKQELLARQDSQPPNAVQKAYSHQAWIPLARDWGGNYLAVDLAPGTQGNWGQVIIFGRDYDCKYVVARSWAHMLASIADDLISEHVNVDEDSGELKLLPFKKQNAEPPYLEILRWRTDQKYGRRQSKRRSGPGGGGPNGAGLHINAGAARPGGSSSPYSSPVLEDRGRSQHRFPGRGPSSATNSPRGSTHVSSPLARVAEEAPKPIRVSTTLSQRDSEKLVSIDSPLRTTANEVVALTGGQANGTANGLTDISNMDGKKPEASDLMGGSAKADKENRPLTKLSDDGALREVEI